jgi:esterase/lipase superfamily enzyme
MINSYELYLRTSDQLTMEVRLTNEVFTFSLSKGGDEVKKILFLEHEETFNIKIVSTGLVGSKAQVVLIRLADGFIWSETLRILKNNVANRNFLITKDGFKQDKTNLQSLKPNRNFGNGNRNIDNAAIIPTAKENCSLVQIFYATNRQASASREGERFPNYNSVISNVKYGTCQINIPHKRKLGELNRPSWWKLEFKERPGRHFMIMNGSELSSLSFFSEISNQLSQEKGVLVFIHGFNTNFEEAILRTAQISYDLGYTGVPICYSWPSEASFLSYNEDEKNIAASSKSIVSFLRDLREKTGSERINIIAHSMGNRALTIALATLNEEEYFEDFVYNQIILAAPDIDAHDFVEELAPKIKDCAKRMTLYASSEDKALQVSRSINASIIRLGESGDLITCADGMDTIDASNTDPSFLGHGYFASTSALINDIFQLLNHNTAPNERNLLPIKTTLKEYWKFR